MRRVSLKNGFMAAMEAVDKKRHWHKLPQPLGLLTLLGIRAQLRATNLYDTGPPMRDPARTRRRRRTAT